MIMLRALNNSNRLLVNISDRFVLLRKTIGYIDATLLSYHQLAIQACNILFSQKAVMEAVGLQHYCT
jgi:hypothetical protein